MYCETVFHSSDIYHWTDKDTTAACPYCDAEAVIPTSIEVDRTMLQQVKNSFFGKISGKIVKINLEDLE
jgi:hypothetical protein